MIRTILSVLALLSFLVESNATGELESTIPQEFSILVINDTLELPVDSMRVYRTDSENQRVIIMIPQSPQPKRIWNSSYVLAAASVVSIGILYTMPPETTNWKDEELTLKTMGTNWANHVKAGPVVDGDNLFLNYVMHPYFGAVYYMAMRGAGYRWESSAVYSFAMSTFFWEYGFEAFFETPSLQDIVVTPVVGSLIGEGFYQAKKKIKKNDDLVMNSRFMGHFCMFLLDPLNEVQDLIIARKVKRNLKKTEMTSQIVLVNSALGMQLNVNF